MTLVFEDRLFLQNVRIPSYEHFILSFQLNALCRWEQFRADSLEKKGKLRKCCQISPFVSWTKMGFGPASNCAKAKIDHSMWKLCLSSR